MVKLLYFDCFSGISGDMVLGALLDLGVDRKQLVAQLGTLNLPGYRLDVTAREVNGIRATDVKVILEGESSHHRHLTDIKEIIETSGISVSAKRLAGEIFLVLAKAEARVHGITIDQVHFHEVGAIDAIVDIVGAAICLDLLQPEKIIASPLHVGYGTVRCAHGILPVPAPATAEILKGVPVYGGTVEGELVTPTGAAIITTITDEFMTLPAATMTGIGYGSGKKKLTSPNLLRVFLGEWRREEEGAEQDLLLLETNIDDMNPEIYSYLLPHLLAQGARDAYLTNIIMKKGRPGVMLSVLCEQEKAQLLEGIIFSETSTLGMRKFQVKRTCLERRFESIPTPLGEVRIKVALRSGRVVKAAPEYEQCVEIAGKRGLPLKIVYEQIQACEKFQMLLGTMREPEVGNQESKVREE